MNIKWTDLVATFLVLLFIGLIPLKGQSNDWPAIKKLYQQGKYCDIIPMMNEYKQSKISGTLAWNNVNLLESKVYLDLEDWEKAEILIKSFDKSRTSLTSQQTAQLLLLEARLFHAKELLKEADAAFLKAKAFATKKNPSDSLLRGKILAHYGIFLFKIERFKAAEKCFTQLDAYFKTSTSLQGKAKTLLGFLYQFQSKFLLAENTFQQAAGIWKKKGWTNHPDYTLFLNDYAYFKFSLDSLAVAEKLLEQSLLINSQGCEIPSLHGFNSSLQGDMLLNLSPRQALPYYLNAINYFKSIHQNKEIAIALNKAGIAYSYLDSLSQAKSHFNEALDYIYRFSSEEKSIVEANILQGLAAHYVYNWEETKADSLYNIIQPIIEQKLGKKNLEYAILLNNMALVKETLEEYDSSLILYGQVEELDTILLSPFHSKHLITLYNLARCYAKADSTEQTQYYYQKANSLQLKLLDTYFGNYSEKVRLDYRYSAMGNFDKFFSFACFAEQPALNTEILNVNLATKNRSLDYSIQTQTLAFNSKDEKVQKLHQQWISQKKELTAAYLLTAEDRKEKGLFIDSLQNKVNDIERDLIRLVDNDLKTNQSVQTSQIGAKLKTNEAAIDFFNYHVTDEYGQFPDSIFYFALISRPQWEHPRLIQLLEDKELKEILEIATHYTLSKEVNKYLYQKIWTPLEKHLEEVETIHLSPDGLLHQISFAGLATNSNRFPLLSDKYAFHYYSNLRDFVLGKAEKSINSSNALLLGNPDYGAVNDNKTNPSSYRQDYFIRLPETAKEINNISKKLQEKGQDIMHLTESNATETTLRRHIDSLEPPIIHLATHGFFFKKDTSIKAIKTLEEQLKSNENPMLRSGLVFADVNQYWSKMPGTNQLSNGVLTAMEVSGLDLSETQLVVLSACDTGRGFRTDGAGVFGLQRAFKAAGVPYLLMSLWKVPDAPTAELMDLFYTYLMDNNPPQKALRLAQKQLRKKYPNPYDWAGFVVFN